MIFSPPLSDKESAKKNWCWKSHKFEDSFPIYRRSSFPLASLTTSNKLKSNYTNYHHSISECFLYFVKISPRRRRRLLIKTWKSTSTTWTKLIIKFSRREWKMSDNFGNCVKSRRPWPATSRKVNSILMKVTANARKSPDALSHISNLRTTKMINDGSCVFKVNIKRVFHSLLSVSTQHPSLRVKKSQ